jgi:hypothetical protein
MGLSYVVVLNIRYQNLLMGLDLLLAIPVENFIGPVKRPVVINVI